MWTKRARLDNGIPRYRVERSSPKAKRGTRARARCVELPRKLWDRIILLMFTCCLFVFLHAFFGFGSVDEESYALDDTFVYPRAPLSTSPPWRGSVSSNEKGKTRAQGMARVMVDWHGSYELLLSTTSGPTTIPQDAFPDPTPGLVGAEHGRAPGEGSKIINAEGSADTPFAFYGTPYDPFRLEFEDSDEGSRNHGLYAVARPPKTARQGARTRRFGRCLPGEACF